ncbi:Ni/Fe hydrogenase subunit alpha [Novipirellula artificiosorum]|uniref:NAD-reducing hydrogenase HoxS subunit beta n=1 Tax=Novipirellula artificiosorum TaxID=2528016 RepID=A0A5C6DEM2_9BACT|nr:Ni/Fe hydrogenase subunit alpha [Novipirellula artificiosorum]TWU34267.1 NAD-reducing hydrogenase HoxS subunit beta [Novipirellula artificiosorum]
MTAATQQGTRKIVINPVTRVEGHGKVTIQMDEANHVQQARLHIIEFRGFERFVQGHFYWEVPVLVQRLCGICPVSHHLAASKACDMIIGADPITPTAEKIRRLMHYGQTYQSHALHFYHLASPDLLFGFDAPVAQRNVIGVIQAHPEIAKKAVLMRKFGQEVIKATAGKKIHGTGSIPGGVNKVLSQEDRDRLAAEVDTMIEWSVEGLQLCKEVTRANAEKLLPFGTFESNFLSIVREDGCLDLYDGNLRAKDADGEIIFDQVTPSDYLDVIREGVRDWSYMKFPFIRDLGQEKGWYRVGPLARINNCDFIDTPIAEAERQEFMTLGSGRPIHATMAYHWARMIELVHSAEKMRDLLADPDVLSGELTTQGERCESGIAIIEAPRGTLIHHYDVNDDDQVVRGNLIVSTTHNNEAMNQAVRVVADQYLEGQAEISEGMLNSIEVGIRAYDPCLSCATHALGQMRLCVQLIGPDGTILDERSRE